MLTFFRRIRKGLLGSGATGKYLLYAIGEITLVVIGILIALQINNWNEYRKERITEISYLEAIKEELADNKDVAFEQMDFDDFQRNNALLLIAVVSGDTILHNSETLLAAMRHVGFNQHGISEQLKDKCIRVTGERVGAVVARGEAEIGFQQVSELLPIHGIVYVGTIPHAVQKLTMFCAGITTTANNIEAATALIQYISSPDAASVIAETGMEPQNR